MSSPALRAGGPRLRWPPMAPRTILYTGKGGVGKTSVAAAPRRRCARGRAAHARALHRPGAQPVGVARGRARRRADAGRATTCGARRCRPRTRWSATGTAVQEWLGELLVERGVDRISAEELTVPPGMDELFSLLQLKRHHESGEWDAIIVDCAPTGETLRLLSFPDVARWWLEKVFPLERQILAAARPIARTLLDIPLPERGGVRRRPAAVAQPDRDERDPPRPRATVDPAGDEPRPDGHRRGDADVHLPEPLRLPDRRGDRQPRVPGRGRRGLLRRLARASSRSSWSSCSSAFAPVPVLRAPYFDAGGDRGRRCSTACGERVLRTSWTRRGAARGAGPGAGRPTTARQAAAADAVRARRGTSR